MKYDKLQYFVGQYCTITTKEINFRYKVEQMLDYFHGYVESLDEDGIWLIHPLTKCKTFIFMQNVVSIAEEQFIPKNHPDYNNVINEFKIKKSQKSMETKPFVDPNALNDLAKKAKDNYQ